MKTRIDDVVARARALPQLTIATLTMYGAGAVLLVMGVITWEPGKNPRWVIASLAGVAVAFVVVTAVRGSRYTATEALVMSAVQLAVTGALTWTTDLTLAAYANGTALLIIGVYTIWFLHPVAGRAVFYAGVAWWFVAALHHDNAALNGFAISYVIQTAIATELFSRIKQRMDLAARTDPLTGTLNRWGISEVVDQHLGRSTRRGQALAVVAVDLDGLREVNNTSGHGAGDELLSAIAGHWMDSLRRTDVVGRMGGDEFLFVLPSTTREQAEDIVRRLAAESPGTWSAGIATAKAGDTAASMLARADQRMYVEKAERHGS